MNELLSPDDKRFLLRLARAALRAAAEGQPFAPVMAEQLSPALQILAPCFVTLTQGGQLRGCMGGLRAERPLYEEVQERTAQSALQDYRFPPVSPAEVLDIEVEISILTEPQPLAFAAPEDLPRLLRPDVDGVVLAQGVRRATFLPQVWERVPDPHVFLSMLCEKMGVPPDTWRRTKLAVHTYQVEKFTEIEFADLKRDA
jgi:hypothetical protein